MPDAATGRCLVCRKAGSADRAESFICEDCAKPDRVTIACACGRHGDFDPSIVARILARAKIESIPHGGLIVLRQSCAECAPESETHPYRLVSIVAD